MVYVMERRELSGHQWHTYPRKRLYRAIRKICRLYNVPRVRLRYAALPHCGEYLDGIVWLERKAGRNLLILAHELAHHIVAHRHPRAQDHGPRWLRYYIEILDILRLIPLEGMLALCRKYNLGVAPRFIVDEPVTKRL